MDGRNALFSLSFALVWLPTRVVAHVGHQTETPSSPLAGLSTLGIGIGATGAILLTGALLLAQEGVLTDRIRSAGIGVGAALLAVGGAVAFVSA